MKISELKLTNFRNHKKFSADLDHDLVLITGSNGTGKTNILEAINLLSTGKSIKAKYDRDMVNYSASFTTAGADIQNSSGDYKLEVQIIKSDDFSNMSVKKAKVNKVPKSLTLFSGIFNSVMFSPEDLNIITGSPSERRRYMDSVLIQTDRNYKRNLSSYVKAVRQRNKILEKISEEGRGYDELGYWTTKCLETGKYIQEQRDKLFGYFNKKIGGTAEKLNGSHAHVETHYLKNEISKERLTKHEQNEVRAKNTLVGPHRDDFSISYRGHDLAEFGSRGEQRSVMLALKLCEIGYIETENKERPVLLLDDIFSELDENHRSSVFNILEQQQTIITSTEKPSFLAGKSKTHEINLN